MTLTSEPRPAHRGYATKLGASPTRQEPTAMNQQATAVRKQPSARSILDVFHALFLASGHPGIKLVEAYGPGAGGIEGVKVRFEWGPTSDYLWAFLFADGDDRNPQPMPFSADVPWRPEVELEKGKGRKWLVADYVLKLTHDLWRAARPDMLTDCTPVALRNVGQDHGPSGLRVVTAGGGARVLRVTIGSGNTKDPAEDPWAGYQIPAEGVQAWKEHSQGIRKAPEKLSSATAGSASAS